MLFSVLDMLVTGLAPTFSFVTSGTSVRTRIITEVASCVKQGFAVLHGPKILLWDHTWVQFSLEKGGFFPLVQSLMYQSVDFCQEIV